MAFLLRLDMGKIFGGIVGESERNIREALNIAGLLPHLLFGLMKLKKGCQVFLLRETQMAGRLQEYWELFLLGCRKNRNPFLWLQQRMTFLNFPLNCFRCYV